VEKEQRLVSVIMPTYNRSKILPAAIESVLAQKYRNIEVIVVDDRSVDNTEQVVSEINQKDNRVVYIRNKGTKGCSGAKNFGIKWSRGEFVAFLDDDDAYLPEKILSQVSKFTDMSNVDCVVTGAPVEWASSGKISSKWIELEFKPFRLFHPCQVMCRRSIMEGIAFCGDYMEWRDFAFQLFKRGACLHLSKENHVVIASSSTSLSKHEEAMLTAALNNARRYSERTKNSLEHRIFREYLANCQKNLANFRLKRGDLWRSVQGYFSSFRTDRRIRNLLPFV